MLVIFTSFTAILYSQQVKLTEKKAEFPNFLIESIEVTGDTASFVLRLKDYELNGEKVSVLTTATVNILEDSSIVLTVKGCGRRIYFGATPESAEKNHDQMIKILHTYAYDIESDIMNRPQIKKEIKNSQN